MNAPNSIEYQTLKYQSRFSKDNRRRGKTVSLRFKAGTRRQAFSIIAGRECQKLKAVHLRYHGGSSYSPVFDVWPLSAARKVWGISVGLPFCNTTTVIVPTIASSPPASKT